MRLQRREWNFIGQIGIDQSLSGLKKDKSHRRKANPDEQNQQSKNPASAEFTTKVEEREWNKVRQPPFLIT